MAFSPPAVGCLVKKGLQKEGVTGTPGPPWLRPWLEAKFLVIQQQKYGIQKQQFQSLSE